MTGRSDSRGAKIMTTCRPTVKFLFFSERFCESGKANYSGFISRNETVCFNELQKACFGMEKLEKGR